MDNYTVFRERKLQLLIRIFTDLRVSLNQDFNFKMSSHDEYHESIDLPGAIPSSPAGLEGNGRIREGPSSSVPTGGMEAILMQKMEDLERQLKELLVLRTAASDGGPESPGFRHRCA